MMPAAVDMDDTMDVDAAGPSSAGENATTTSASNSERSARTRLLHRVRFVDWNPSAVTAIAVTPITWNPTSAYPYASSSRGVLAIARQNGNIEIYTWLADEANKPAKNLVKANNAAAKKADSGRWVLEKTLAVPYPSRVEHLVFTHQTLLSESDLDLFDEQEQARELEKLAVARPRLFSAGGGSDVWEWEWGQGLGHVKRTLSSQGGAIWSMATNPQHTLLALGCDDGSVRIVSLWDGEFEHVRKLSSVKTRILSIAWGPMQIKGSPLSLPKKLRKADTAATPIEPVPAANGKMRAVDFEDVVLVTGCADSSVRVWDARSGMCRAKMTTDKIEGEQTLVWAVAVLQDGTIVSGDSLGIVAFWDSKTHTQIQNIKPHRADVLALTVGSDGKTIFSSGVDQHVVQLQRTLIEDSSAKQNRNRDRTRWTVANSKRYHSHDVRALCVSPPYSLISHITPISSSSTGIAVQKRQLPILVSGGLDFTVVYNTMSAESGQAVRQMAGSKSRLLDPSSSSLNRASYIPARNAPVNLAPEAKLVSKVRPGGVDIYKVGKEEAILEMEIKLRTACTASAISPDGVWLAVSDLYEVKTFKLKMSSQGVLKAYRNSAVSDALASHPQLKDDQGASVLHFSPDSSRLIIATIGARVAIIDLPETKDEPAHVLRVFSQHRSGKSSSGRAIAGDKAAKQPNGAAMSEDEEEEPSDESESDEEEENGERSIPTIACAATSVDGQWLVTADLSRRMHVFNLDILQHHSPLPSLPAPAAALAFSSLNPSLLAIGAVDNTIAFLDIDTRTVPNWAYRLQQGFNTAMKQERDPITGIAFDPKAIKTDTIMVHGPSWHINGRMNGLAITTAMAEQRSKRKLADSAEEEDPSNDIRHSNVKSEIHVAPFVSRKFGSILLFDFASDGELVLVERPYFDLLAGMAPAFAERRYGTL